MRQLERYKLTQFPLRDFTSSRKQKKKLNSTALVPSTGPSPLHVVLEVVAKAGEDKIREASRTAESE